MSRGPYVADRPLYLNAKGKVVEANSPDREILLVGVNGEIPYDRAVLLGLVASKPNGEAEEKMISGPQENKAILSPSENKAIESPAANKIESETCSECGDSGELRDGRCPACRASSEIGPSKTKDDVITGAKLAEAGMVRPDRVAA